METFDHVWKHLGGRKLVAFILSLIALTLLAWFGKMEDGAMWTLLGLYTAFSSGNVGEHLATAMRLRGQPVQAPVAPVDEDDEEDEEDEDDEEDK